MNFVHVVGITLWNLELGKTRYVGHAEDLLTPPFLEPTLDPGQQTRSGAVPAGISCHVTRFTSITCQHQIAIKRPLHTLLAQDRDIIYGTARVKTNVS